MAAPVVEIADVGIAHPELAGKRQAGKELRHRHADVRRLRVQRRLRLTNIGTAARQRGGNADRHDLRQGGHRFGRKELVIQRAGRFAQQHRQPVHRLARLRLILGQLRLQ